VNKAITGMRDLLNQSLGPRVTILTDLDPGLSPAMADTNQLELAILNLSINARDAMPDGGTLMIRTGISPNDPGLVAIEVSDSGTGMSPEVVARAFDPFYTTKPIGKGTGLGLSQVYGIAKQSGGDVTIDSRLGEGTTVTILLPRAESTAAVNASSSRSYAKAESGERLLVVDDDPDVRDMVCGFLIEMGYDVRAAVQGESAIKMLSDFRPDMIIIDFAMPGISGAETAVTLRDMYPGIPILFISGFANAHELDSAVGSAPLLRKPFLPAELSAAVRSMLDARTS
jgi:CheY-like chemotaxis protein